MICTNQSVSWIGKPSWSQNRSHYYVLSCHRQGEGGIIRSSEFQSTPSNLVHYSSGVCRQVVHRHEMEEGSQVLYNISHNQLTVRGTLYLFHPHRKLARLVLLFPFLNYWKWLSGLHRHTAWEWQNQDLYLGLYILKVLLFQLYPVY